MPEIQTPGIERRLYEALKAAWKYVDRPFTTNSARAEVGQFALADFQPGKGLAMLFALQTAWGFVHNAKDTTLMAEMGALLRHGEAGYALSPEKACECGEEPAESPGP